MILRALVSVRREKPQRSGSICSCRTNPLKNSCFIDEGSSSGSLNILQVVQPYDLSLNFPHIDGNENMWVWRKIHLTHKLGQSSFFLFSSSRQNSGVLKNRKSVNPNYTKTTLNVFN